MRKQCDPHRFGILVFADGASLGNPGPGGWGSIIANPKAPSSGQIVELGGYAPDTTNNRMELSAVIGALQHLQSQPGGVAIHTDSVYVIRGITQWTWAWRRNDWKTSEGKEVANPDLWKILIALVAQRGKENPISWHYVRGHIGTPGNERVDQIATDFAKTRRSHLYRGPLLQYSIAIYDIPEDTSLPEPKAKPSGPKPSAFSYLSVLGNTPMRHSTWAECERRVKGKSGAKFKKAMDEAEEQKILQSWGFSQKDLKLNSGGTS